MIYSGQSVVNIGLDGVMRITAGNPLQAAAAGDPYWSSVVLLAVNDNAADGTTTFADQSTSAKTITVTGTAQYDTAQAPTGMTSSALFDGTGDYLTLADSADWHFGSGDFTIEGFQYKTATASDVIIGQWDNPSQRSWIIETDNAPLNFYYSTTGANAVAVAMDASLATSTWTHWAASRIGNTLSTYSNGTRGAAADVTGVTFFDSTGLLYIADFSGGAWGWAGNLCAIRITKGVGRYSGATITPPTLPLPTS